jgi:hypothetical protein
MRPPGNATIAPVCKYDKAPPAAGVGLAHPTLILLDKVRLARDSAERISS